MPWLRKNKPIIDCDDLSLKFPSVSSFTDSSPVPPSTECSSVLSFADFAPASPLFNNFSFIDSVTVDPSTEAKHSIPSEYHRFKDVFSETMADILPSARKYDCPIDLVSDYKPPFKPIYHLAPKELQCLREYIDENSAKGGRFRFMTFERTILDFSLVELDARRRLNNEFSSSLPDNDSKATNMRPYLSKIEREFANNLPESVLKEYFKAGEFVHVPMTKEERVLIEQFKKFNKKIELSDEDFDLILEMLPGRSIEDLKNYSTDQTSGEFDFANESILVFMGHEGRESLISLPAEGENHFKSQNWTKFVQKQFSIFESSGSITQIACRTGPGHSNARVMIGACATQEERYNRVGEMLLAYRETPKYEANSTTNIPTNNYDVLILDGHKRAKSSTNGNIVMRQTVTCVVYDPLTDIFFSGGYDGNVVAWGASTAVAIDNIGSHPKPINSIACHATRKLITYGCQSGGLYYFNAFESLGSSRAMPSQLFCKPKTKDSFSNTVDHVAIPVTGARSNTCFAGIGFLQSFGAGVIEGWDLGTGSLISSSERLLDGLTCMSISPCGTMLAAGTGGISSDEVKGDGIVRIMSLNQDLKTSIAIKTNKLDLDCVSFCPNSTLLFMGETSDSSIAVYDLRFPSEPLFTTSHGTNAADAIVAHAWLSKGNILATGGHDGQVKIWDCQRGFSSLNKFEFNSSISCITYSDIDHSIWVGTDNGGVYMLASPGTLGENHPPVISGKIVY